MDSISSFLLALAIFLSARSITCRDCLGAFHLLETLPEGGRYDGGHRSEGCVDLRHTHRKEQQLADQALATGAPPSGLPESKPDGGSSGIEKDTAGSKLASSRVSFSLSGNISAIDAGHGLLQGQPVQHLPDLAQPEIPVMAAGSLPPGHIHTALLQKVTQAPIDGNQTVLLAAGHVNFGVGAGLAAVQPSAALFTQAMACRLLG